MADDTPASNRISVSRDALRAELAEMELRLRIYFDEQLKHKASAAEFAELSLRFMARERGEFTDAQVASMRTIARDIAKAADDAEWTPRQRLFGAASALACVGMFILSTLLALHGGKL